MLTLVLRDCSLKVLAAGTSACVHAHVCVHVYVYLNMHKCVYKCVHAYMYMCECLCMCAHKCVYMFLCMCMHMCVCVQMHVCVCLYAYVCIHECESVYVHGQECESQRLILSSTFIYLSIYLSSSFYFKTGSLTEPRDAALAVGWSASSRDLTVLTTFPALRL